MQQNKIPKLRRLPIVGLFGGLAFHEAMVTRNLEYCGQQVGFIMYVNSCQIAKQNTISFQDGKPKNVNNTQGLLLLSLHLTKCHISQE
jgi:hypothetical protein